MSEIKNEPNGTAPRLDGEAKKAAKKEIKRLQKQLLSLQQPLKNAKVPVVLLFEGPSASGKGRMISEVISELDPRGYQVYTYGSASEDAGRRPFLWRFWCDIPPRGEMSVLDHSWYAAAFDAQSHDGAQRYAEPVNVFERQLADDGYLILKFYLSISRAEQRERLEKLASDDAEAWRVDESSWRQNRSWDKHSDIASAVIESTSTPHAPWHVIENGDKVSGTLEVLRTIAESIASAIESGAPKPVHDEKRDWPLLKMPKLGEVDLSPAIADKEEYDEQLKREKKKLQKLHSLLYREQIPVVLAFEGWDAAGKGGAIRRLSWALDPRGFDVVPIAAPSPDALSRHYLWRFWREIPRDGHVVLFDRSWYGRVMVERIEGLTPESRWSMAYDEINEFEYELHRHGAVVLKFWLHIDSGTQLERFRLRESTPDKKYKITSEDWRNRDKWPQYEAAVDEMLQKTSTAYAPWCIVEGNDKRYARIKVLKTVRKALEERL